MSALCGDEARASDRGLRGPACCWRRRAASSARRGDAVIVHADGPDPAARAWPTWPYPVGCLVAPPSTRSTAFDGPTEAESGSGRARTRPAAATSTKASTRSCRPDTGAWSRSPPTRAVFASGLLELGLFWLSFELDDGAWRVVGDVDELQRRARSAKARPRSTWAPGRGPEPEPRDHGGSRSTSTRRRLRRRKEPQRGGRTPEFRRIGRKLVLTIWLEAAAARDLHLHEAQGEAARRQAARHARRPAALRRQAPTRRRER